MWKVFYGDGSTCDECERPPARGVQVIVQDHPRVGVELVSSADYYVKEDGHWRGVDIFGLFDYLIESGIVLFGRTVTQAEYNAAMAAAMEHKAGWLPRERKVG
jgi:hypothetical protein